MAGPLNLQHHGAVFAQRVALHDVYTVLVGHYLQDVAIPLGLALKTCSLSLIEVFSRASVLKLVEVDWFAPSKLKFRCT